MHNNYAERVYSCLKIRVSSGTRIDIVCADFYTNARTEFYAHGECVYAGAHVEHSARRTFCRTAVGTHGLDQNFRKNVLTLR